MCDIHVAPVLIILKIELTLLDLMAVRQAAITDVLYLPTVKKDTYHNRVYKYFLKYVSKKVGLEY